MNEKDALKKVEKNISEWKSMQTELNEVINYFKENNKEAYVITIKIAETESQLIEEAYLKLNPLLEKLKKSIFLFFIFIGEKNGL